MATIASQPDLRLPDGEVIAPPSPTTDPTLCLVCGVGKRAGSGILTRCVGCIKIDAQRARDARAAAEAIVVARRAELTKACRSCGQTKALADYTPHHSARDKRRKDCKVCVSTGRAKGKQRTPDQLARDRERAKRPERKAQNLEAVHRWQANNKAALQAHKAVSAAVRDGKLTPPSTCQVRGCRRRKRLHAHHSSYHPRRRMLVVWMCAQHHKATHNGLALKLKAGAVFSVARAPATA